MHWLDSALKFIVKTTSDGANTSTFDTVTSWLLKTIHKNNPNTFLNVASDVGLYVVQRMNEIEAAAMWTEANISFRSARIILSHLTQKFKHRVQVPLSQVVALSGITKKLEPIFDSFVYRKNSSEKNKEDIGEKIEYWSY